MIDVIYSNIERKRQGRRAKRAHYLYKSNINVIFGKKYVPGGIQPRDFTLTNSTSDPRDEPRI